MASLTCIDRDKIINLLHHPNLLLPAIQPCNTPNPSNTKKYWKAEEATALRDANSSKIIDTYFLPQRMVHLSTMGNFLLPLEHTLLYQKHLEVNLLITHPPNS
jgi:hypothetical protein